MAAVLFVRIKSELDQEELERRIEERRPRFLEVPGLVQKIYGQDETTGDACGIYFFEDQKALAAFRESELAQVAGLRAAAGKEPSESANGFLGDGELDQSPKRPILKE